MVKVIQQILYKNIHIIVESPSKHCSSCICSVYTSLLRCSFCFCLLLISLFLFFLMANSSIVLKFKIVEHVTNIDENC